MDQNKKVFAENLPYWQTSKAGPDTWIERTVRVLKDLGGTILMEAFGKDSNGHSAFMLTCQIAGEQYRIVWPVMGSKTGNERAARVQAATMLYHDIKAKALSAMVLGTRAAFFTFLQLPGGQTPAEATVHEVSKALGMFALGPGSEDVVEGEYREHDLR